MGRIKNAIKKYLNIDNDIREEVRHAMGLGQIELNYGSADRIMKYYQELNYNLFTGDPAIIEAFYKEKPKPTGDYEKSFWKEVDNDTVKVHYPLPSSISRTMAHVLFGDDLEFRIDTGNKEVSKKLTERLNYILQENKITDLLQRGSMLESYSGSLGAPLVVDTEFAKHPIIQLYPAEQIELVTKYGRICEVIFTDEHKYNNKIYTLKLTAGMGYLEYRLYDDKGKAVPLETIDELAGLKDVLLLDKEGKPVKILLAGFKPNKAVSTQFVNKFYGASDYEGLYGIFDSLDEVLSGWMDTYRNAKIFTFTSEDNLSRDPKTGNILNPKKFGLNTFVLHDSTATAGKETKHERDIPVINVTPFRDGFQELIKVALTRVGLSPISMGILDTISRLSSQESLAEREKVTLKTRQEKMKIWIKFLKDMSRLLLVFDDLQYIVPAESDGALVYTLSNTYDYDFLVEFPQYEFPSRQEQLRNAALALNNGLVDHETIITEIYKDEYDEAYIATMIANILARRGGAPASPDKDDIAMEKKPEIDEDDKIED